MVSNNADTARLIWVESVLDLAAYDSQLEASECVSKSTHATTFKRRIRPLEVWLKRDLFSWDRRPGDTSEEDWIIVSNRNEFIPVAWKISQLIDAGGLRENLGRVRVHPDGKVFIDKAEERTKEAIEIGRLMVASRAIKPIGYRDPPKVAKVLAKDIDMDALLAGTVEPTPSGHRK